MKGIINSIVLTVGFAVSLGGCATLPIYNTALPKAFKPEVVASIRHGLPSAEVLAIFGPPTSVKQAVCGASTGREWNCTTWDYGKFPYDRASFTFDADGGSLVLNNFEVRRTGVALPASFTADNVLKVRQGIASEEIEKMFGLPSSVRQAVCGSATGSPWTCTTWEYGEFPYGSASFTFASLDGSLVLNNYEVKRD